MVFLKCSLHFIARNESAAAVAELVWMMRNWRPDFFVIPFQAPRRTKRTLNHDNVPR